MKPTLIFWYEFASTYSYLTAMRIDAEGARAGVAIEWRPFLLGPIFKSQGWTTSPFNVYPAKGRYMVRDITRIASERGLPFRMPETFPANGLKAARLAIAARGWGATAAFSRAVFEAQFAGGEDISDDDVLAACLTRVGLDPASVWPRIMDDSVKAALKRNTEMAQGLGIFGAPSFTTADNELFWGDDRLAEALRWASAPMALPNSADSPG
ncbi:2-hydroxychromene-2-carboxylate isomerase [Hyphomicrobium sp.]|jgi:2-hydroxychromene-2-carboxylate isomerase|uniref:2-hydroxychromene-2-carboxylate isomerase n=1 Tax=Hyphomicrobium sp. TaxID=82 RepID=UPI002D07B45C|nr:2-hydroxychromene-2-carboxylate isomerase [Hyphomicrobium sp.]HVZ05541.1 2-hydroxychromene-2-carboxylate isomerase [Hyphomicrobium sp.]